MYCPNCAAQIDGTKFCRSCGANVSLVPQALTGQLSAGQGRSSEKSGREVSVEAMTSSFFSGIGLFVAAFAVLEFAPAGRIWWFWLLIPAFGAIGRGIGQYLRWRETARCEPGGGNRLASPPSRPEPLAVPEVGSGERFEVVDTGRLPGSVDRKSTRLNSSH